MKFSEMYEVRFQEAVAFKTVDDVINAIKDGTVIKYLNGKKNFPEWIKKVVDGETVDGWDIGELKHTFGTLIERINKIDKSSITPNSAILFLIKKSTDPKTMDSIINYSCDALIEFAKSEKSEWVKSLASYNDFINQPYSIDVWHNFEKESQERRSEVAAKRHKSLDNLQKSNLYNVLYEDKNWGLYVPKNHAGDSELASHMVPFETHNVSFDNDSENKGKVVTKAQWCTAADPDYYDSYTSSGNVLYVIKKFTNEGLCDEAFQVAFPNETGIEFKDKFDEDNALDPETTHIRMVFDAPDKLLSLIVNDNPYAMNQSSVLDYKKYLESLNGVDLDDFTVFNYFSNSTETLELISNIDKLPNYAFDTEIFDKKSPKCLRTYYELLLEFPNVFSYKIPVGVVDYLSRVRSSEGVEKLKAIIDFQQKHPKLQFDTANSFFEGDLDRDCYSVDDIRTYLNSISDGSISDVPDVNVFDGQILRNLEAYKKINNLIKELNLKDDTKDAIMCFTRKREDTNIEYVEDNFQEFAEIVNHIDNGDFDRLKRNRHNSDFISSIIHEIGGKDIALRANSILENYNMSFSTFSDLDIMPYDFLREYIDRFDQYLKAVINKDVLTYDESSIYAASTLMYLDKAIELMQFLKDEGLVENDKINKGVKSIIRYSGSYALEHIDELKQMLQYVKGLMDYVNFSSESFGVSSIDSLNERNLGELKAFYEFMKKYGTTDKESKEYFDKVSGSEEYKNLLSDVNNGSKSVDDVAKTSQEMIRALTKKPTINVSFRDFDNAFDYLRYDEISKLLKILGDCIDKGLIKEVNRNVLKSLSNERDNFKKVISENKLFISIYNLARV